MRKTIQKNGAQCTAHTFNVAGVDKFRQTKQTLCSSFINSGRSVLITQDVNPILPMHQHVCKSICRSTVKLFILLKLKKVNLVSTKNKQDFAEKQVSKQDTVSYN